jgi:hypothetical protein
MMSAVSVAYRHQNSLQRGLEGKTSVKPEILVEKRISKLKRGASFGSRHTVYTRGHATCGLE